MLIGFNAQSTLAVSTLGSIDLAGLGVAFDSARTGTAWSLS